MKRILLGLIAAVLALVIVPAVAGCDRRAPASQRSDQSQELEKLCPISIHQVRPGGSLVDPPVIRPEHVDSMSAHKQDGHLLIRVTMTPEGEQWLWRFTKSQMGQPMAIFCGADEIQRPIIRAPFGKEFDFALPIEPD